MEFIGKREEAEEARVASLRQQAEERAIFEQDDDKRPDDDANVAPFVMSVDLATWMSFNLTDREAFAARLHSISPSYVPGDCLLFAGEAYQVTRFEPEFPFPGYHLERVGPGVLSSAVFISVDQAEQDLLPMA